MNEIDRKFQVSIVSLTAKTPILTNLKFGLVVFSHFFQSWRGCTIHVDLNPSCQNAIVHFRHCSDSSVWHYGCFQHVGGLTERQQS